MATSVADLSINVSANIANAVESMNRLGGVVQAASDKFKALGEIGKSFLGGLVSGLSVGMFTAAIKASIDYADRLNDLAKTTGIAVETLGGLGYAAKQSGVNIDVVAKGVNNLARTMASAAGGNTELLTLFSKMGVSIKNLDGSLRPLNETLFDVANKFKSYKDGPEKAALANELFKKGGEQLIPLLNEGGESLRKMVAEFERYGGVTTEVAQRADAFNDTIEKIKLIAGGLFQTIASALLPVLQTLADQFVKLKTDGSSFQVVAEGITAVVKGIAIAATVAGGVFQAFAKHIAASAAVLGQMAQGNFRQAFETLKEYSADQLANITGMVTRVRELLNSATSMSIDDGRSGNRWADSITAPFKVAEERVKKLRDSFATAFASMQKVLMTSEEAFKKASGAADLMSPSLKKLIDMAGDPEWKTFSATQQQWIIDLGLAADALDHETVALEKNQKLAEELAKIRERTSAIAQREIDGLNQTTEALADKLEGLRREGEQIGKTEAQLNALVLARQQNTIRIKEEQLAVAQSIEGNEAQIAAYESQLRLLREIQNQTATNQSSSVLVEQSERARQSWLKTFEDITSAGAGFLEDLFNNGSKAFENLWENFKRWALAAFAKIAAQQIVVSLVGSFGGGGLGAAGGLLGGGGGGGILDSLGSLFGGQGGGGSLLSSLGSLFGGGGGGIGAAFGGGLTGAATSFALSGAGTALGLSTAIPASALGAGAAAWGGAAAAATTAGTALTGLASSALLAVPVVGWIAAAGLALYAIFSKDDPDETKGRIAVRPISSDPMGFEDQRFAESRLGRVGFVDQDTQQFSGEVAMVLNDMLASALDAFASRMDSEGVDRLAKILQETTFDAFEGEFSTEDFLNKFGGQALQEVVQVAFQELEPALAAVVSGFSGTAEEVANFSNALLGIYDVTRDLPEAVRANIIGALDATQETADKVLAFAAVLMGFGDVIDGVRPQLEALDPESIIAFVDALGGAQLMAQQFAFLSQNFLTDADRLALATEQLSTAFEAVELTVEDLANAGLTSFPKTHAEFMRLLSSFDLMTDEGLAAYAAVMRLAQAFVAINGTAEQAAQGVAQLVGSAEEFFSVNFFSDAEQAAARVADAVKLIDDEANRLGVDIPRTMAGFRDMIVAMQAAGLEGTDLYAALIVLGPAILELNTAMVDVAGSVGNATDSLGALQSQAESFMAMVRQEAATLTQSRIAAIDALVSGIGGDLGDQMALKIKLINEQIQQAIADVSSQDAGRQLRGFEALKELQVPISYGSTQPSGLSPLILSLTRDLARFTVLEAQFDGKRAEQLLNLEKWYAGQQELFRQSASAGGDYTEALTALEAEFKRKWDEIIKGVSEGVEGTIGELEKLRATLAKWLQSLNVSELSPLKPLDRLAAAKTQFDEQLKLALGGDKDALAGITQFADQYLRIARDLYKSSSAYTDIFDFVTKMIAELAGTATTGLPYPPELPPRVPPIAPLPPSPPVVQLPPIAPLPAPSSPLPTPPPLLGPPQALPIDPLPAPPPMPAPVLDSAWTPPPNMELLTGFTDKWDVGASIASVLPANGARLASSEDMMALAKRVDAVVDALAALADANSEDSRHEVDELTTVRRAISSTFETLK